MEIGTAVIGSAAIFSGVMGGTITLIKFMSRKNNNNPIPRIENPGKCTDPDCKGMLAETAAISARNTQDIRDINKIIDERLIPKIDKTQDATLRMMTKLDTAIKVNGEREDQIKEMFGSTIKTSVEEILGFKKKDDK